MKTDNLLLLLAVALLCVFEDSVMGRKSKCSLKMDPRNVSHRKKRHLVAAKAKAAVVGQIRYRKAVRDRERKTKSRENLARVKAKER